jgi:MGT family glycosyltransferase
MSTVCAFTTPARGHLYPLVGILAELARRGHRVKVWTLADEVDVVRGAGIEATAMDPAIEALPLADWEARTPAQANAHTFGRFLARAPHEIDDVRRALDQENPDLLITDINAWGAPAAAEASGVPWATFSPYFTWLPSPDVPAFGPGMKPMRGPVGRVRDVALAKAIGFDVDRRFLSDLNVVRATAGAGPLDHIHDLWTRPPLLVYMTVPELEYPRRGWPDSFRFVGHCPWGPGADTTPDWLEDVDRPLVLVTASTEYQADDALIATALEALAHEDVQVVATTAGNDPALFTAPQNARVERFVPHGPLLARAEVVVCHGGMGITQKALAAGVPLCVVGWGRDQLESGRRVEVAGAGVLVTRKRLSAGRLAAAIREARACRPGAQRVARAFAAARGAAGAADELEGLIGVPVRG